MTLTDQYWGFDLLGQPLTAGRGVEGHRGDWDRVEPFLAQFGLAERQYGPVSDTVARGKQRYLRELCDLIEFRAADQLLGVMVGAPEDWSSYYVRVLAFRPETPRACVRLALGGVLDRLAAHGIQRCLADTSVTNKAAQRLMVEQGWYSLGALPSERYGLMCRYCKILDPAYEQGFSQMWAL